MKVNIADIIYNSTIEWGSNVCMVIFLRGCPYRCWYCSNWKYQEGVTEWDTVDIANNIKKAAWSHDAVVFSGGEPLMQLDALRTLATYSKSLGLKTALHTSGRYPTRLLGMGGLFDAVMIDFKAPLHALKSLMGWRHAATTLRDSLTIMQTYKECGVPIFFEVRTTVFRLLNDTPTDIEAIASRCGFADQYVLQQGRPELAREERHRNLPVVGVDALKELALAAKPHVKKVVVRSYHGEEVV
jgi:pyruvate formate lyase activating enzyme